MIYVKIIVSVLGASIYVPANTEKAHVAAGGPFCGVRAAPPQIFGRFYSFVRQRLNFLAFLRSFARRRLKNWYYTYV